MPNDPIAKDPLRFRVYYWLMDICLVSALIGLVDFILVRTIDLHYFGLPEVGQVIVAIPVLFFSTIVPLFLMVGKFMRDEYAEGLWRRSVVVLAYACAVLPLIFFIVAWMTYFALDRPEYAPAAFAWSTAQTQWGWAIAYIWFGYMMLYVTIFQFLRWRDSR